MAKKKAEPPVNPFPAGSVPFGTTGLVGSAVFEAPGRILVAENRQTQVEAHATSLFGWQIDRFTEWAERHPTTDPRFWLGMAEAGIHPLSPDGMAAAAADIQRQIEEGTYGVDLGSPASAPPVRKPAAQTTGAAAEKAKEEGGFWSGLWDAAIPDSILGVPLAGVQTGVKATVGGLESVMQSMQAGPKVIEGRKAEARRLADKYDIPDEYIDQVFSPQADPVFSGRGSSQTTAIGLAGLRGMIADALGGEPDKVIPQRYRERVEAARAEYLASDEWKADPRTVAETTTLGSWLLHPETFAGEYPAGSVVDLKTGRFVNPDTGEPVGLLPAQAGWLPSATTRQMVDLASVTLSDITTLDEQARGIAPMAWTPGRQLAHTWYSPDEANFNLVSGLTDAAVIVAADPVNLIPLGKAGMVQQAYQAAYVGLRSVPRLGNLPVRSFEAFDPRNVERVVVRAPAPPRPGATGPVSVAADAAKDKAAVKAAQKEVETVLDPATAVGPSGLVTGRTSRFVVNSKAWEWLQTGQGARVVQRVSEIDNFYDMWHMLGGARSNIPVDTVSILVKADTPEAVRAALGTRLGTELVDHRPFGALSAGAARRAFGYGVNGAMLESVGLFTKRGRSAHRENVEMLEGFGVEGIAASFRSLTGAYRRPFRLSPAVGRSLDARDKDTVITEVDRFARGARLSREDIKDGVNRLAVANSGPELYQALYGSGRGGDQAGVFGKLMVDALQARFGMDAEGARSLSTVFAGGLDEAERNVLTRDLAYGAGLDGVDGIGHTQLLNESLGNAIHLPSYARMTRATRAYSNARRLERLTGASNVVADVLQGLTTAWRSAVLVRPAYIPREVGELLFAMSLAGGRGMFTHPARFAAAAWNTMVSLEFNNALVRVMTAPAKAADKAADAAFEKAGDAALVLARNYRDFAYLSLGLQRLAPGVHQAQARLAGRPMWDDVNLAVRAGDMERMTEPMYNALGSVGGNKQIDQARSVSAGKWAVPVSRDAAAGSRERREYLNDLVHKVWILTGDRQMRDLADPAVSFDEALARFRASDDIVQLRIMHPDQLTSDPQSEVDYLMQYADWLKQVTGEDPEVLQAVATGMFRDTQIRPVGSFERPREGAVPGRQRKAAKTNAELRRRLDDLTSDPATAHLFPERLTGYRWDDGVKGGGETVLSGLERLVDGFFEMTGGIADVFARGPAFREAYTDRVLDLIPHMTPAAKADAVAKLRAAGDYALARKVQNSRVGKAGFLDVDTVDAIALGHAQAESRRMFYDAARRQNYAVALRVIGPFLQATTNTFRRWGQMSYQNPQMMYRALKPLNALLQPGSASIYQIAGAATGDEMMESMFNADNPQHYYTPTIPETTVDGFFFTDEYGDRKFAFPLVGRILQALGNENAVATASASGLNVAGNTLSPGVGPVVTFAQSQLVTPGMLDGDNLLGEALRFVNPYGLPDGDLANRVVQSAAPTWARKGFQGTTDEYQANAAAKVMWSLAASGRYDLSNAADVSRMIADAKRLGQSLSVAGAVLTAFAPAASLAGVHGEVVVPDEDGGRRRLVLQGKLLEVFRRYTADDYSGGMVRFVEDFGYTALYGVLPRTKAAEGTEMLGSSTSDDVWAFRTEHPDAYRRHSDVIGLLFAGGDPDSEFSQNLYRQQKAEGERVPKTPEEYAEDVNQALGWILWDSLNDSLAATELSDSERSRVKIEARRELQATFPGWTGKATDLGKFDRRLDLLVTALEDPEIQGLAAARPIADYIATRSDVVARLYEEQGTVDLTAKKARPYAEELLRYADEIAADDESGGFMTAWDRLFSAEFEED